MNETSWAQLKADRIGDMHPVKALCIRLDRDGDVVVSISMNSMPLGELFGDENATVEFCSYGGRGRSLHTVRALIALMEAMKKDSKERPDADPKSVNS